MKFLNFLLLSSLTLISAEKIQYVGVNEAGAEFGEGHLPGIYNTHYIYPNIKAIEATVEQGMNAFRFPTRWERLQHELYGELTEFDLTEYKKVIDATTDMGAVAIIDPHNYARYYDDLIGSEEVPIEAFADFWTKIAEVFKDNENVWFGLVNEPHDMDTDVWFKAARAAVDGIRSTGAKNNILIPGNGWTGAWSWDSQAWYGESNAKVALRYFNSEKDENIIFETHQYFNENYSGGDVECVQRPCQNLLKEFVSWLKKNNFKGWIGEIGAPLRKGCKECVTELLEYVQENRDTIVGVQWWAAGPWWGTNDSSIEPNSKKEFPEQMTWLKPFLPGPSELTEVPVFVNRIIYCDGCVVTGTGGDGSLWGWENDIACPINVEACADVLNNNNKEEKRCKFEALGYKCCSHCISILEDQDGLWGAENGEWCGIYDECSSITEKCWSEAFGYLCCEDCNILLKDESGAWGV